MILIPRLFVFLNTYMNRLFTIHIKVITTPQLVQDYARDPSRYTSR